MDKILCVHQGAELYGSDRSFIQTIKILRARYQNSKIHVVLPENGPLVNLIKDSTDEIIFFSLAKFSMRDFKKLNFMAVLRIFFNIPKILKLVQDYEVVYINTIVIFDFIIACHYMNKKIKIIHVREIPNSYMSFFFRNLLKFSRAYLIFNSHATKKSYFKYKNEKSFIVYNAVPQLNLPKSEKHLLDQNTQLKILLIGRINAWKGQDLLIKTIAESTNNLKDNISIRIVGNVYKDEKQYLESIEYLIKQNRLENCVKIYPFASDPSIHYGWSDLVIVPSKRPEPFGLVAIEAMSASKPVIGANHGGLSEIIVNKQTGCLFQPNNPKDLEMKIRRYINNPKDLQTHGFNGYNRYKKLFSIRNYSDSINSVLDQLIIPIK
jgi:glycosyltransferase involved in cell wall biosynthesis